MHTNNENATFHIGLCLAGAISAGAYTAGVLDYLFEALEIWEEKKKSGDPGTVPQHKVIISVIGGASAGGMSGLIAAKSLISKFKPVHVQDLESNKSIPENPLYHAWVDQLEDELPPSCHTMFDYLLSNDDISSGNVQSLLNANFVRKIADKIIDAPGGELANRAYLSDELRVFTTLTNLQGLEYSLNFIGGEVEQDPYRIHDHRDFARFSLGDKSFPGWVKVDFEDADVTGLYKSAAIGTGAFPIGLSPVKMRRSGRLMQELDWLSHVTNGNINRFEEEWYETTLVDGGMMNNEPFEKVQDALNQVLKGEQAKDLQDYSQVKSTILMVDPFPSKSNFVKPGENLIGYVKNLLSVLMNQARIKPKHLKNSLASNKAGQYVISPVRYEGEKEHEIKKRGDKAIACGSMDGFGGFLSKEFRVHDFFLGRANCEKFLMDHFTIPVASNNPIFEMGYSGMDEKIKEKFMSKTDSEPGIQIIPLFIDRNKSKAEMPIFKGGKSWPSISESELEKFRKPIKTRSEKILMNSLPWKRSTHLILQGFSKIFLKHKISKVVMNAIKKSLEEHGQISG